MKYIFCLLLLVLSTSVNAQVAINNDNSAPDASAMLDVKSTNKGLLVPRMTQAQRTAITTPASGLLVYQTDNPSGFYYYSGAGWFRLSLQNEGWSTTGNAGTDPTNNFIGTTDNQPLSFRLNNAPAGKFDHLKENYFIGRSAGLSNGDGYYNIGIGNSSLQSNINSDWNIAIGDSALFIYSGTFGENIAIGARSLRYNTDGSFNTAVGSRTLYSNIHGNYNVAVGHQSLYLNNNGMSNTAIGYCALKNNNNGGSNTAIGYMALVFCTDGILNTAIGEGALYSITNGSYNTALGYMAGSSFGNSVNNVTTVGYNSGFNTTPDNHINIGNTSNVWIGGQVNWGVWSDKRIKKDIQQNVPGLSFIMKLKPVTYHLDIHKQNEMVYTRGSDTLSWPGKYEIEDITQTGFIAQEVEQAAKETNYDFSGVTVPKSDEGLYSIRYAEFVVPLVKAVQELSQSNDELKAVVNNQQLKIEELENTINKLTN